MKVLITGANGQLGTDLCRALKGEDVIGLTHADADITDLTSFMNICRKYRPSVIVNTASYVRVDDCEDEVDRAFLVNALGACNVAVVAQEIGALLVHISSDYVFGGEPARCRMSYTEYDVPVPLNTYGRSKLAGEEMVRHHCSRHLIIRSSGLFGVTGSSGKGGNFIETILTLARKNDDLKVVNDQTLSPTCTKDLAVKIIELITTGICGTFHITNRGTCTWYEFTREILRLAGIKKRVIPVTSDHYPQKALRPHYSILDNYNLRLLKMDDMRTWQDALSDYLRERKHIN